jgi:hypothetical protein
VAGLAAGAGLVVFLARKWARRATAGEAKPDAAATAAPDAKPDTTYDARIDEELRGDD